MPPQRAPSHPECAKRSPSHSPQPKRPRTASPSCHGRADPGRPGEERALYTACIGFEFALHTPVYMRCAPAATPPPFPGDACGSARSGRPNASFATKAPPCDPGRQTRARCACRAALGRWASNSAPPPGLGHAPIPPDSSISKSTLRDLDFECPAVAFKIERAKCQVGAPSQSSMTRRSFRYGFALAPRCCRQSCSTRQF